MSDASRTSGEWKACSPNAIVCGTFSRAPQPWERLSPFFPHGGIPVPYSGEVTDQSVEGIWQALEVFQGCDVDPSKLDSATMKG
ncbi:DUF6939 family protein [Nocardia fusca]|uniref:DUF6939 family protein n=1 Tax=Nocardia fusca TaxID=941183 RepID=UPI000A5FEEB3